MSRRKFVMYSKDNITKVESGTFLYPYDSRNHPTNPVMIPFSVNEFPWDMFPQTINQIDRKRLEEGVFALYEIYTTQYYVFVRVK